MVVWGSRSIYTYINLIHPQFHKKMRRCSFSPPKVEKLKSREVSPTPLAEQLFDGKRFLQIFQYFSHNALQRRPRYRGKMGLRSRDGGVVVFCNFLGSEVSKIDKLPVHAEKVMRKGKC